MDHARWMELAAEEYRRLLGLLRSLDGPDWSAATECGNWTVHDIVAHLAGSGEATASIREAGRQRRAGKKLHLPGTPLDAMNEVQVRERSGLSATELVDQLADVAPRALRARRRLPAPLRAARVPLGPPLGVRPLGYLAGRIYTRDAWMHRIDIGRATGRDLELTPDHDGAIVADIVEEWSGLHGRPFQLTLTGIAGGSFGGSPAGEHLELDAIEFCRVLSGRGQPLGDGLLAVHVPF